MERTRAGASRPRPETEQAGKGFDEQTGSTQEVFGVGVGSVLWTHLSYSAFRAGRPQREEDRETGSWGSTIKTLSGREEGEKKTQTRDETPEGVSFFPPGNKRGTLSRFRFPRFGAKIRL